MTRKEKNSNLSIEWLRQNMAYEPSIGMFFWKVRGPGKTVGKMLGTKIWSGYLTIKADGIVYYAHRLAWFYVNGAWPPHQIDHVDGDKSNNAIANLRLATPAQNSVRRKAVRAKLSPSRGVFPHGTGFVARIHSAGKRHYLGYFSTAAAARAAYEAKAKELHGEFVYVEPVTDMDAAVADAVKRSPHRDWLLVATPGFAGAT